MSSSAFGGRAWGRFRVGGPRADLGFRQSDFEVCRD